MFSIDTLFRVANTPQRRMSIIVNFFGCVMPKVYNTKSLLCMPILMTNVAKTLLNFKCHVGLDLTRKII